MNFIRNCVFKNAFQMNCLTVKTNYYQQVLKIGFTLTSSRQINTNVSITSKINFLQNKLKSFQQLSSSTSTSSSGVHHDNTPSSLQQIKKRQQRKKRILTSTIIDDDDTDDVNAEGFYNVIAYTTAEEYDLEALLDGLEEQNLYIAKKFFSSDNLATEQDVLYVTAKYQIENEPRDIFFFREGSIVLWNCNEVECNNVLQLIKKYEKDRYRYSLIKDERETMTYTYLTKSIDAVESNDNNDDDGIDDIKINTKKSLAKFKNGKFYLTKCNDNFLEKYTFSNALTASIKLGIWEATLNSYINSLQFITEDLKRGTKIRINRHELLRKTGELFALRHLINLSSDLLDIPDFYWDREELEKLYLQICNYFSITRRTKVMNEKLNHCIELAELVSSHLNDAHHVRLEWMIIILIMVEVGFEIIHYAERYYSNHDNNNIEIVNNSKEQ